MPVKTKSPEKAIESNVKLYFDLTKITAEKTSSEFMRSVGAFSLTDAVLKWVSKSGEWVGVRAGNIKKTVSIPLSYVKWYDAEVLPILDYIEDKETKCFFKPGIKMHKEDAKDAFVEFAE